MGEIAHIDGRRSVLIDGRKASFSSTPSHEFRSFILARAADVSQYARIAGDKTLLCRVWDDIPEGSAKRRIKIVDLRLGFNERLLNDFGPNYGVRLDFLSDRQLFRIRRIDLNRDDSDRTIQGFTRSEGRKNVTQMFYHLTPWEASFPKLPWDPFDFFEAAKTKIDIFTYGDADDWYFAPPSERGGYRPEIGKNAGVKRRILVKQLRGALSFSEKERAIILDHYRGMGAINSRDPNMEVIHSIIRDVESGNLSFNMEFIPKEKN